MTKRILTYTLLIAGFMGGMVQKAFADTDYVVFVLNETQSVTQKATGVINEVSLKSQEIASAKVTPGGYLGDKAAEAQEKAELSQEKVENAEEKRNKLQDRMDAAKDAKNSLMEKYNNLSSKISEYKEKADETIAEGNKIREQYKNYKGQATDANNQVQDERNQLSEGGNNMQETFEAVGGIAESKVGAAKEKVGIQSDGSSQEDLSDNDSVVLETVQEENEQVPSRVKNIQQPAKITQKTVLQKTEQPAAQKVKANISNKAEAISSAGIMAKAVAEQSQNVEIRPINNIAEMPMQKVSVEDVITATKSKPDEKQTEVLKTKVNFEDQLVQSSNRTEKVINIKENRKELIKDDEIITGLEKFQEKPLKENDIKKLIQAGKAKPGVTAARIQVKERINEKQ